MRSATRWISVLTWVVASSAPVHSQRAGDLAVGRQIAEQWCSECHKIDAAQSRTKSDTVLPALCTE
jgi:mono/diheme cytochrome c family protein